MKKIYLAATGMLLLASATHAQISKEKSYSTIQKLDASHPTTTIRSSDRDAGEIIVSDDFSDDSNWTLTTEGGTTPLWEIVLEEPSIFTGYIDDIASTTEANGFAVFNGIKHILDGTVTEQNALLEYSTGIDCGSATGVILEFEQAYRAYNTDQTWVEISIDNWSTSTKYELNTSIIGNGPTIQEKVSINITEIAAGETNVKVRFRWLEETADASFGSGYGWMIDDFQLVEAWNNDLKITEAHFRSGIGLAMENGIGYHSIPLSQQTEINFAVEMENFAGTIQNGAKVNAQVSGTGSYTGSSASIDMAISTNDSLSCTTTFTPSGIGVYNIEFWVDSDATEENTTNDTLRNSFSVTADVYARDNGFVSGVISNVTGNSGESMVIGNVYDIYADDLIGAVDIAISNAATNEAQSIFAQVLIYDEISEAFILAERSPDHDIIIDDLGGFIRLFFTAPVSVTEGQTILVLAGHYGNSPEVEFYTSVPADQGSVLGYTAASSSPFSLINSNTIMVRPIFRDFTGIEKEELSSFSIEQNRPNPFHNFSIINYSINESANIAIQFTDISGKIVESIEYGILPAGNHSITINAANFTEGVYFYTITVNDQKITKKMVVN